MLHEFISNYCDRIFQDENKRFTNSLLQILELYSQTAEKLPSLEEFSNSESEEEKVIKPSNFLLKRKNLQI